MYRILIFVLAGALLLPVLAHASDASSLPSRKAAVVLPLLKKISKEDTYSKIEKILGISDMDIGSGMYVYVFRLDDSTSVTVGTNHETVFYIYRAGYGVNGQQVIYNKSENPK